MRAAAVAARSGEATFFRNLRAHSRSSLSRTGADAADLEPLTVRVDGLDEALPEGWVPQLIKIDVEGHEVDVLRGARRVLALHRPIVVIEHGFSDEAGRSSRDLHGLLREAGLAVLDIDGGGPYDADAFVRRAAVGDLWTYVARPAQGVASVR